MIPAAQLCPFSAFAYTTTNSGIITKRAIVSAFGSFFSRGIGAGATATVTQG
jgi:hypothetical protein